jgi:uncharacterized protein with PIN domain
MPEFTGITGSGSQQVLRFLCDEMLHGLGRWLRAAGYDTVIAEGGIPDRELATLCSGEDRVLLTKDRHLAATAAGIAPVVLVQGSGIDETARALRAALDVDWQHAPFSRCMVDNRPLEPVPPFWAAQVPERSRAAGGPLRMCPECDPPLLAGGVMFVECSSGLLPGNRRRPHPANRIGLPAGGERSHRKSATRERELEWFVSWQLP